MAPVRVCSISLAGNDDPSSSNGTEGGAQPYVVTGPMAAVRLPAPLKLSSLGFQMIRAFYKANDHANEQNSAATF